MPAHVSSTASEGTLDQELLPATLVTVAEARDVLAGWRAPRRSRRNYEADMLLLGRGFLALLDDRTTDSQAGTVLPGVDVPVDRVRARISGWHFAQESLTARERELLYVVEGLVRLVDSRAPGGYLR